MLRRYLGHMTDPRSRRTNHKAQVLLAHAHWAPGCHAERRHYRSREDSARLDRGTGKIKVQLRGSKSGYLSNSVPAPHLSKGQQTVLLETSQQSSPVLSAVSGHPCAVRSLWSSPVLCLQ
ncbi:unnamed protein product, partial [Staurois parvus]